MSAHGTRSWVGAFVAALSIASASLAQGTFDPKTLNGKNGYRLTGGYIHTGRTAQFAGDTNGDGYDDLVLGAGNGSLEGRAFLVFGGPDVAPGGNASLLGIAPPKGFAVHGIFSGDDAGFAVAGAGDMNADGLDDFAVGAMDADPGGLTSAGEVYLIFGTASPPASGHFFASALNGANGIKITGAQAPSRVGWSLAGAGDMNGDGLVDLLIGAPAVKVGTLEVAGAGFVVFGSATLGASASLSVASLNGSNGFAMTGVAAFDQAGWSVAGIGDLNADGFADVAIGAIMQETVPNNPGKTFVVYGGATVGAGGSMSLGSLFGPNGFRVQGLATGDELGLSAAGAGDVNADGMHDLVIGAPHADVNGNASGSAYVIFGASQPAPFGGFNLAGLNGSNGFALHGKTTSVEAGRSVGAAGDVNRDGVGDLLIGAPSTWVGATVEAGECAVVYGGAAVGGAGTFQLSSLNGASGFVIQGIKAFDKLGWFCAGGGDANGDGVADGLATAYGGSSNDGEAYVCLGISPFVAPYGTGTQGCSGFHTLGANAPPNVGSPGFALVASAAPPSSLGLLLVGDAQNAAGSDSLGIFLVFHVDLFASTLLVGFDMPSDLAGEALASVPIPASPSIAGATLYAQGIFQWRPTGPCFPSPFRLSSTPGLSLVLQP